MSTKKPTIHPSWYRLLADEFSKPYFLELKEFLLAEKQSFRVFPPGNEIFTAFNLCPVENVKVVILGQDPYHGFGQAHGLCFSVKKGIKPPPSLVNIYKELHADLEIPIPQHGELTSWAQQGVLLLNSVLTVREKQAGSHQKKGWEQFTDRAIQELSATKSGLVFLLWGKFAQQKKSLITANNHLILEAAHPSPFSAHNGFFGCKHFSKTNSFLLENNNKPIDWSLA